MNRQKANRILMSLVLCQAPLMVQASSANYTSNHGGDEAAILPQNQYEASARVDSVSRKNGGQLYRLDLAKPIPLTQIKAKPKAGKVKVIGVNLVTDKGERVIVKAFNNVTIADSDSVLASEILSLNENIASIEIQAEAMGGNANLDITAVSGQEAPKFGSREQENSCNKKFDSVLKEKLDTVQTWAGRAESSTQGSWQEKYAKKEFNKYVAEFVATLKADKNQFASPDYMLTLVNFFVDRHNASRPESAADVGYKTMAVETFDTFLTAIQSDQACRPVTSDSLIKISLDFQKRQDANKPDSRARKLYDVAIGKIGKLIPGHYRKEIAAKNLNFRQADTEGYRNYKLFVASKPESLMKNVYQEMAANAYSIAEQQLMVEVKSLNNEQTYQLIVEYQTKYNDPANFPQETMAKYLTILSEHSNFLKFHAVR
ncbi:beta-sandwich domain-containing protein [Bdellovibrio sp. HCB288]|uniref:beta-sandwich domain-containing protein n=1 Tax=Bdellovibrio sp. HCB288 TaxID=3394355 RepID=UPI0039B3962C